MICVKYKLHHNIILIKQIHFLINTTLKVKFLKNDHKANFNVVLTIKSSYKINV